MSAGRRRLLGLAVLAACAVAWALAARWLWHSTVPPDLRAPRLSPRAYFSAGFLARSASYERFLAIDALLAALVLLAVLGVYARRGARLMRESAAGPIGTGMMLGMLALGIAWLAELPFGLAAVWWERRHHVSHQGYVASVVQGFLSLGGTFLSVSLALLIAMALARWLRRWWWLAGAPLFAGIALLLSFLSIYLIPDVHPLASAPQLADARVLARREGVPGTRVEVQDVARFTTAPNAEAAGFGSTRRVILWDTLLDGRFTRRQIRVVMAHELGHVARDHPLKGVGWLALLLLPALALVALATRRRGGLARPEAVPVALFVLIGLSVVTMPLRNVVSRHVEQEADWIALQATHDPSAARGAFQRLATTSLSDPDPPAWVYVLDEDHPTIMQRIATTEGWRP